MSLFDPEELTKEQKEKLFAHLKKKAKGSRVSTVAWLDLIAFTIMLEAQVPRKKIPELNVDYAAQPDLPKPLLELLKTHIEWLKKNAYSTEDDAPLLPSRKKGERIDRLTLIMRWNRAMHACGIYHKAILKEPILLHTRNAP